MATHINVMQSKMKNEPMKVSTSMDAIVDGGRVAVLKM